MAGAGNDADGGAAPALGAAPSVSTVAIDGALALAIASLAACAFALAILLPPAGLLVAFAGFAPASMLVLASPAPPLDVAAAASLRDAALPAAAGLLVDGGLPAAAFTNCSRVIVPFLASLLNAASSNRSRASLRAVGLSSVGGSASSVDAAAPIGEGATLSRGRVAVGEGRETLQVREKFECDTCTLELR